ncbi:MAG: hypothetical protein DGJ47_000777, partial [Rickettsiaceae bacterium]
FIGTGYVGLVSGVVMGHLGHNVTCTDVDSSKIKMLQNKQPPIYEAELEEYLIKYANTDRLNFTDQFDGSLAKAQCVFITVGTPPLADGSADLSIVFKVIEAICPYVNTKCVFVLKSTVPPGTCDKVQEFINTQGYSNSVASNPEFLREGSAISDFIKPDRIVIGANDQSTFEVMRDVYKPLTDQNIPLLETDLCTSELIKYASNTFLANKIAFINELSDLCEIVGADVNKLSEGIGLDQRIGRKFLNPGPGFGGSCFPKDILALQNLVKKVDSDFLILDAIINSNSARPQKMVKNIVAKMGGDVADKKITILGLTYKANTDDLRASPAIKIINELEYYGAKIVAYDPEGMKNSKNYFSDLECANSLLEAVKDSDAIIIVTEWSEFKNFDYSKIYTQMKTPMIFDLRNILSGPKLKKLGFLYHSIGKKS